MRAAEFKLMEAECYYHIGKPELALHSINELRSHRISDYKDLTMNNLPSIQDMEIIKTDAEGNTLTPLMGLILRERRKNSFWKVIVSSNKEEWNTGILDSIQWTEICDKNICIHFRFLHEK